MSKGTLYDKVLRDNSIPFDSGRVQLVVHRHYIHEVTSPPAFDAMVKDGLISIPFPELNTATLDHVVPTDENGRKHNLEKAVRMELKLIENCQRFNIELLDYATRKQGIVHIIGPEMGLTQPGMVIVCGDSHTSTHGAFGNVAYGIGTTQVEHVLRTGSLAHKPLKVRKIRLEGKIPIGVEAKDIAIQIINELGTKGIGYAHELVDTLGLSMEERMTICNMGAEGSVNVTYFNPDMTTFEYMRGRERVPKGTAFESAISFWSSYISDRDARYDDEFVFNVNNMRPRVTWGTHPGQSVFIDEPIPQEHSFPEPSRKDALQALAYIGFRPGEYVRGKKIDVAFIGSCTNSRISDLKKAAAVAKGYHVAVGIKAMVVPGSMQVKKEAEMLGLDRVFIDAGFEWRDPGCSLCLGMNVDRIDQRVLIASTSNRNYENRQGDGARTVLMSPVMAAYAAIQGTIGDVREHSFNP